MRLRHGVMCAAAVALGGLFSGCAAPRPVSRPADVLVESWSQEGLSGRRIVTPHYEVFSTLRDAGFEAALPEFLEAAYRHYQDTIATDDEGAARLTMYVLGTRSQWEAFSRRRFPARFDIYARIRSGGFTEGDTSVVFYVSRASTFATLAHEGWHQYVGGRVKSPIPAWLNEGLACYHEAYRFGGAAPVFTPKDNTFRINNLREGVKSGRLLTLREVVDTDAGEVIVQDHSTITQVYYAQAWSLVTFLRHGDDGRHAQAFEQLLKDIAGDEFRVRASAARLAAGDRPGVSPQAAAFEAYFGQPPEALSKAYHDHLVRTAGF